MRTNPKIAITIGDLNGIGSEVILKALAEKNIRSICEPIVIGPRTILEQQLDGLELDLKLRIGSETNLNAVQVLNLKMSAAEDLQFGKVSKSGGLIAGRALETAIELAQKNDVQAVVTAPISKQALNLAGYAYPGHTEILADRCNVDDVVMVLLSGDFRVALVTTHCALSEVPKLLTTEKVLSKLHILNHDLKKRFKIDKPKIAIAALNPHAGESGLFGHEEREIITPAILEAKAGGVDVSGPYPADTLFARLDQNRFDAYLAMYHDQGLIPLKMQAFGKAVNYTAGLPFIRTSPDHGTAFDIAGKGVADSTSMQEAIKLAVRLAKNSREG